MQSIVEKQGGPGMIAALTEHNKLGYSFVCSHTVSLGPQEGFILPLTFHSALKLALKR